MIFQNKSAQDAGKNAGGTRVAQIGAITRAILDHFVDKKSMVGPKAI